MDLVSAATELLSVPIVLAVFGITYAVRSWLKGQEKYKAGLPGWFLFIPGALGSIGAFLFFYGMTPMEELAKEPWWRNLLAALIRSGAYFGASVGLWRILRKRFEKKLDDEPGTPGD